MIDRIVVTSTRANSENGLMSKVGSALSLCRTCDISWLLCHQLENRLCGRRNDEYRYPRSEDFVS